MCHSCAGLFDAYFCSIGNYYIDYELFSADYANKLIKELRSNKRFDKVISDEISRRKIEYLKEVSDFTLDSIDIVGDVKGGLETLTGYNFVRQEKLTTKERIITGITTVAPFVFGAIAKRVKTILKSTKSADNISAKLANKLLKNSDAGLEGGKRLNTYGDAIRNRLGPASKSHPEELDSILNHAKELNVRVEFRPGTLAYEPSLSLGKPGRLILDPEASIGAVRHEYRHMLDDMEMGYPGFKLIADSEAFWKLEFRGYMEEIRIARQLRDYDAGRFILQEMRARRMEILGR